MVGCHQSPSEGHLDALGIQPLLNIHHQKMNCLKSRRLQHGRLTLIDTKLVQKDLQYRPSSASGGCCAPAATVK